LKRFGAYNGVNVDGGGSTTMVMADCQGKPVRLNRSSFVAAYGRERNIGHNFGVHARAAADGLKDSGDCSRHDDSDAHVANRRGRNDASRVRVVRQLWQFHTARFATREKPRRHDQRLAQGSNYFFPRDLDDGSQQFTQACGFRHSFVLVTTQLLA
jgi:hypothetical protein